MIFRLLAVLVTLTAPSLLRAESVIETITIYNRPASEIQPLLAPLLEDTDAVVANGDTMIVKTSPERLKTLTDLIKKLDSPLTNLRITVLQSREVTADQLNADVNAGLSIPSSDPNEPKAYAYGYFNRSQSRSTDRNTQTLTTLEGEPAQIRIGSLIPLTAYQRYRDGYGHSFENRSTQLVEASTGFSVTPRLTGEQITLDVLPWSNRASSQGRLQVQQADTSVRVNLGEWVEIGAIDESGQTSGSGILSANKQILQNTLRTLVKVDRVR